jgi:hypothetical protein
MDTDGNGLIDGVEFIRYFFKLGQDARFQLHYEATRLHEEIKSAEKQKDIDNVKL